MKGQSSGHSFHFQMNRSTYTSAHLICYTEWNGFRTVNASPPPVVHLRLCGYTAAAKLEIIFSVFVDLLPG